MAQGDLGGSRVHRLRGSQNWGAVRVFPLAVNALRSEALNSTDCVEKLGNWPRAENAFVVAIAAVFKRSSGPTAGRVAVRGRERRRNLAASSGRRVACAVNRRARRGRV